MEGTQGEPHSLEDPVEMRMMWFSEGPQRLNGVEDEGDGFAEEDEMFRRLRRIQGRVDDFDNIPIMLLERCHHSLEFLFG